MLGVCAINAASGSSPPCIVPCPLLLPVCIGCIADWWLVLLELGFKPPNDGDLLRGEVSPFESHVWSFPYVILSGRCPGCCWCCCCIELKHVIIMPSIICIGSVVCMPGCMRVCKLFGIASLVDDDAPDGCCTSGLAFPLMELWLFLTTMPSTRPGRTSAYAGGILIGVSSGYQCL